MADARIESYIEGSGWAEPMAALRVLLLEAGLGEERKWGKPCYTHGGANVAILQDFKGFCALLFFKGSLMSDPAGLLRSQGKNTQAALRLEVTTALQVAAAEPAIRALIAEAIRVEDAGLKPAFPAKTEIAWPDELVDAFDAEPDLRAAFEALTPGRQRAYVMHFAEAKQSATRAARIAKQAGRILEGRGLTDR